MKQSVLTNIVNKHSSYVTISKVLCMILALLLISFIIIFSLLGAESKPLKLELSTADQSSTDNRTMVKPRFFGSSSDSEFYKIFATHAVEDKSYNVSLGEPYALITLKDKSIVTSTSEQGVWLPSPQELELTGRVTILYGNDYNMSTEAAKINVKSNTIFSNDKTLAHTPSGSIEAAGFTFFQKEKKIIFNGPVRTSIYP